MTAAHLILVWEERDDPNLLRHAERAKRSGATRASSRTSRRSGRAPRTTRGRPRAARCTASAASEPGSRRGVVRAGRAVALGVEEELFFVDAETLDAAPGFSRVVGEADERVKPELFESLVELATPASAATRRRCSPSSPRCGRRSRHVPPSHGLGCTPPAATRSRAGHDQEIVPLPRYREDVASARRRRCWRQLVCGLHVHVSMPDADTACARSRGSCRGCRSLLALSANSPFAEGEDTGLRSDAGRAAAADADRRDAAGPPRLGRLGAATGGDPTAATGTPGRGPSTGRSRCA